MPMVTQHKMRKDLKTFFEAQQGFTHQNSRNLAELQETENSRELPTIQLQEIYCSLYVNIQGLESHKTNKIPDIYGLLTESNMVFVTFTETYIKDCMNSEV